VWVGFDRPRSLGRGETSGRAALPIWVNYMSEVLGSATGSAVSCWISSHFMKSV
jgi:membrane carboxypeptidase/penicillin-binding protein